MTNFRPQLALYVAQRYPLVLTRLNLHWAIGNSITTDTACARLEAIANLTIALATLLNPEASLAILALRACFAFLKHR